MKLSGTVAIASCLIVVLPRMAAAVAPVPTELVIVNELGERTALALPLAQTSPDKRLPSSVAVGGG